MRELKHRLRWVRHSLYWAHKWAHHKATLSEIQEAIEFLVQAGRDLDRARAFLEQAKERSCES